MTNAELNVVTGAFSHTGKHIARRLLAMGQRVRTLTNQPGRASPFGGEVEAFPFHFDRPAELARTLSDATTLYNTYWIRFACGRTTFEKAVANSRTLLRAAEEAGVRRIVHISITNPSEASPLPYFRGKALVEKAITESRLSYAILRPTVIFGTEGILINNIAWLLRRFPLFAVPGAGDYRIQPVFGEDLAEMAIRAGGQSDNALMDAIGPESFTFNELVQLIARAVGRPARLVHVSPALLLVLGRLIGRAVRDVLITRDEIRGLMDNLLVSDSEPTARTRFSEWVTRHATTLGMKYASELARHFR